jgi:monofunctional glycosyltransferase
MIRLLKRVALVGVVAVPPALALAVVWGLPSRGDVRALASSRPKTTSLMRQREREAEAKGRRWHPDLRWIPLELVSRNLIQAVVASEDQRFFEHHGVDWAAVRESFAHDVEARRVARGGSTITQQLAKNLFFGTRKSPLRKLRELVTARWLEEDLTKPRILEIYLNVIEWGDGTWGAEAAARHWYGVPARALTREQAAGLAAMIPNPRRINPRVSPQGHERLTRRVLWLMDLGRSVAHDVAGLGAEPPPEAVAAETGPPGDLTIPPELVEELDLGESEEPAGAPILAAPTAHPPPPTPVPPLPADAGSGPGPDAAASTPP